MIVGRLDIRAPGTFYPLALSNRPDAYPEGDLRCCDVAVHLPRTAVHPTAAPVHC